MKDHLPAVCVEGATKILSRDYRRSGWHSLHYLARNFLRQSPRDRALRSDQFLALSDVSLTLPRGEALALIGPNGSGKSTLLKCICGILKLDGGTIAVNGTMAPMINLSSAMMPVLTVEENIHLNLRMLGCPAEAVAERAARVIEFTQLTPYLATPYKFLSTGTAARVGFGCSLFSEADIFISDEVLAVGDNFFREKCLAQLERKLGDGKSLIVVSHISSVLTRLCGKALELQGGRVVNYDAIGPAMATYLKRYGNQPTPARLAPTYSITPLNAQTLELTFSSTAQSQSASAPKWESDVSFPPLASFGTESRLRTDERHFLESKTN